MKISVFTTATNPISRGDIIISLASYDFADEIIVVDGGRETIGLADSPKMRWVQSDWPKEFDWPFIGQQFQKGYEAATQDWVIHADLDFIFHENDYAAIRQAFNDNPDAPALSFWKYQFIIPDKYNLKSRLVIAVNKGKYGDRIRFDSGGDLCQPSLDGKELRPDDVPEARVPFYNYDFLLKTKEQIKDDIGRMDRAYQRRFGKWLYSKDGTEDSAYEGWLEMVLGRYSKPQESVALGFHPKYIQETLKHLKPEQFGHSAFGHLQKCKYII